MSKSISMFVFDTETTGFPGGPYMTSPFTRIVQLSAAQMHGEAEFDEVVNPEVHIPSPSTEIHGVTNAAAAAADAWPSVFRRFLAFLRRNVPGKRKVGAEPTIILVAHNARFDMNMLEQMGRLYGTEIPSNVHFKDTLPLFRAHFTELHDRAPHTRPFNLGNLYKHVFEEDLSGAHNALVDVRGLKRLVLHAFDEEAPWPTYEADKSLMDIRGIGKTRAIAIERFLQQHRYRPAGQKTVLHLRAHFQGSKPGEIEEFVRKTIRVRDDGQVLDIVEPGQPADQAGYNDVGILTAPDGSVYTVAVMIGRTQVADLRDAMDAAAP